jgi:hypothetical protein
MKKNLKLVLILLIVTVVAQVRAVDLKLNLEKGKTYFQNMKIEMNMKQEVMGQKMDIKMIMIAKMSYLVKNKLADKYEIESKFANIKMNMKMPQGSMEFDSEKPQPGQPMGEMLAQMKNMVIKMTMNNKGKVLKLNDMDKEFDKIVKAIDGVNDAQKAQMKKQISQSYGNKSLKSNIEMSTAIFPDKEVKIGDTWKIKTKLQSTFEADVESTFKLVAINDKHYILESEATINANDKAKSTGPLASMQTKFNLNGDMTCKYQLNKNTCWTQHASVDQVIKGKMEMNMGGKGKQSFSMPMNINSKTIITDK